MNTGDFVWRYESIFRKRNYPSLSPDPGVSTGGKRKLRICGAVFGFLYAKDGKLKDSMPV